ncbi:WD40-repeat-containing domain protein [Cubamyces lactineus]|nr:WD40-repeat-containing domain protein [Cubamyces lactineus]
MSSMHMYSTVTIFAPLDSPLRRLAAADAQHSLAMPVGVEKTWSLTLALRVTGTSPISALAFSLDGMCIACGSMDGAIQLRNTHTGTQMQALEGHTSTVRSVSFSPTGKELLSGSEDGTVYVHDVATEARLCSWVEDCGMVLSVAWSLDGILAASACERDSVRLWKVSSPEKTVVLRRAGRFQQVVFAPDGNLLSSSFAVCHVWDARSLNLNLDSDADMAPIWIQEHGATIAVVAVSPDSRLVACGLHGGPIVLSNKSDGRRVRSLPSQSQVMSLVFYPNNALAAAYNNVVFTLWDVSTGAELVKTISNEWANAAAFLSDRLLIAHAVGGQVQIRLCPSELEHDTSLLGQVIQRCRPSTTHWCSTADDRERRTLLRAVATSPTGKLVAAVYEDELRVYGASTGRCERVIRHLSTLAPMTTWSPTSNLLTCSGKGGVVRVWKADTGERVGTFTGHSGTGTTVVFAPDEQHILFGSFDGAIHRGRIRQSVDKTSSQVLFQSDGVHIIALALSPDGHWILSAATTGSPLADTAGADLLAIPSVTTSLDRSHKRRPRDRTRGLQ